MHHFTFLPDFQEFLRNRTLFLNDLQIRNAMTLDHVTGAQMPAP